MRIIFAGTPEFAAVPLEALLQAGIRPIAVYTQPDAPAGRGRKLTPPPVKTLALAHQIPVYQPLSLKTAEAQAQLESLKADLMIVVAYGQILPQAVLDLPTHGCWNIHASLLPRWRGAAPIQRAIEAGDGQTGVTIMQMNAGLDTGDMLYHLSTPILAEDTSQTLHDRLADLGAKALLATLNLWQNQELAPQQQDHQLATYAKKLSKEEGRIQWSQGAYSLARQVQAFNPWPMGWCLYKEQPLKLSHARHRPATPNRQPGELLEVAEDVLWIATGDGDLGIAQLQPAGKKTMSAQDFVNGYQPLGQCFG